MLTSLLHIVIAPLVILTSSSVPKFVTSTEDCDSAGGISDVVISAFACDQKEGTESVSTLIRSYVFLRLKSSN